MMKFRTPLLVMIATAVVGLSVVAVWYLDARLKRSIDVSITQSALREEQRAANSYAAFVVMRLQELERDLLSLSTNAVIRSGTGEACSGILKGVTDELSVSLLLRTAANGNIDCASDDGVLGVQLGTTTAIAPLRESTDARVGFGRGATVSYGSSGQRFMIPVHVALRSANGELLGTLGAELLASQFVEALQDVLPDPGAFFVLDDDGGVIMHTNVGLLGRNAEIEDPFQIHGVKSLTKDDLKRFRTSPLSEVFGTGLDRNIVSSAPFELFGRKLSVIHVFSTERYAAIVDPVNRDRSLMFWVITGIFVFLTCVGALIMSQWNRDTSIRVQSATGEMEQKVRDATMIAEDYEVYKKALDVAEDNISIANAEGQAIYLNASFSKVTGFTPKEALWKKAGTLWGKQMDVAYYQRMWQAIKTDKRAFVDTIMNKRKDGTTYRASISITPVKNEAGEVTHYIAVERPLDPLSPGTTDQPTEINTKKSRKKGA